MAVGKSFRSKKLSLIDLKLKNPYKRIGQETRYKSYGTIGQEMRNSLTYNQNAFSSLEKKKSKKEGKEKYHDSIWLKFDDDFGEILSSLQR
ncbi:unnamed protein product [Lactuca virosa]|uniref:Uncharacterized protein n=1 Tax=Lactuca virosa TaxID=75947 RepID=A0AAU9NPZ1_9ASTR|nr:unnamed protein product [Lactuca virosa]